MQDGVAKIDIDCSGKTKSGGAATLTGSTSEIPGASVVSLDGEFTGAVDGKRSSRRNASAADRLHSTHKPATNRLLIANAINQWLSSHTTSDRLSRRANVPNDISKLAVTRDGRSLAWSFVVTNHPFLPLRHRAVRLLWSAAVVSDIGTWVQLIVVGSLVAAETGSAVQTGLVALATFAPQSIASPVGGCWQTGSTVARSSPPR